MAPFPTERLPILASCLQDVGLGPVRHARISTGEVQTALKDLGATFWNQHTLNDGRAVVHSLVKLIDWRRPIALDIFSTLRMPFAAELDTLSELPASHNLLKLLEDSGLRDPHELSSLTAFDIAVQLQLRPRQLLELLAALNAVGAVPVPSDAPPDYPGMRLYHASDITEAQLVRIDKLLGKHDAQRKDIRFRDLLEKLPTHGKSVKACLRDLRKGIKRAGNRDPWPKFAPVLTELERRVARFVNCTLEEALKDIVQLVLGSPRQVERVALRMGWLDGNRRKCAEAAAAFGVTEEVIRRHEHTVRTRIASGPSDGCGGSWFCPQIHESIRLARRVAPCSANILNCELHASGVTRLEWRPGTLLATAELFGVQHGMAVTGSGTEEHLALALTRTHARKFRCR